MYIRKHACILSPSLPLPLPLHTLPCTHTHTPSHLHTIYGFLPEAYDRKQSICSNHHNFEDAPHLTDVCSQSCQ